MDFKIDLITLKRGNNGLGFNIRGGVDAPHLAEDPGIFVTKIREAGAAVDEGSLRPGDKVLELNGKPVSGAGLRHDQVVSMFKQVHGNSIRIKVDRQAEQRILAKRAKSAEKTISNDSSDKAVKAPGLETPPPSPTSSTLTLGTLQEQDSKRQSFISEQMSSEDAEPALMDAKQVSLSTEQKPLVEEVSHKEKVVVDVEKVPIDANLPFETVKEESPVPLESPENEAESVDSSPAPLPSWFLPGAVVVAAVALIASFVLIRSHGRSTTGST